MASQKNEPAQESDIQAPSLVQRVTRNRAVRLGALGLLLILLIGAGVFAFLQYRASTVDYALKQLNLGIAARNVETVTHLVDFVSLSRGLATAIVELSENPTADSLSSTEHRIQEALLRLFTGKGSAHAPEEPRTPPGYTPPERPKSPLDDPIFDILRKPTHVLPADLMDQLVAKPFTLLASEDHLAVVETRMEHPRLELSLPLRLTLIKENDTGWQVREIAGVRELVNQFWQCIETLKQDAMIAFEAENSRVESLMNTYYNVENCKAILFPPDPTNVVRLRLVLTGTNLGDRELVASASRCEILDQTDTVLGTLRLENIRAVRAGESFEHSWFYNFEQHYPEVKAMLAAESLSCRALPATVSLGKGQLLYPRKIEDLPGVQLVE